jgi:FKBP-type peptidyl-prolyl cis-trans isomerase FkpA
MNMYQATIALLIVLWAVPALAETKTMTGDQETLYAVGLVMARQLTVFSLSPEEFDIVKQGLQDGMTGKTPLEKSEAFSSKIKELAQLRRDAHGKKAAQGTKELLDKALKEKGAVQTASGLIYIPRVEGKGANPAVTDKVTLHYRGTLVDGQEFDNTKWRGQPTTLTLASGIKCWTEGIPMMKAGGKARLICPSNLAFGKSGTGLIPTEATVIYDVELIEAVK